GARRARRAQRVPRARRGGQPSAAGAAEPAAEAGDPVAHRRGAGGGCAGATGGRDPGTAAGGAVDGVVGLPVVAGGEHRPEADAAGHRGDPAGGRRLPDRATLTTTATPDLT